MASQWYCKVLGQEVGPVSFPDMGEMVSAGTLKEEDQVRRKGTSQWIPAREVIGLFRAAAAQKAKPAPSRAKAGPKPAPAPTAAQAGERSPAKPWRMSRRHLLLASGIVAVLVVATALVSVWRSRQSVRFPEPQAGKPRPLEQLAVGWRPSPPEACSVPGLEKGVPQLVAGLEEVDPAWAPTLTADLCTIVFTTLSGPPTGEDLYLATRSDASEPFGPARRIEASVSREPERMPALSPDGLELLFVRSYRDPRYLHCTRPTSADDFGEPVEWSPPGLDLQGKDFGRMQFFDPLHLKFGLHDRVAQRTLHFVAQRAAPASPFGASQPLPLTSGLKAFFAGNTLRQYFGTEKGLFMGGRQQLDQPWSPAIPIVELDATGPIARGVWVGPAEDVVVYSSPGPGGELGSSKRLWMMRF